MAKPNRLKEIEAEKGDLTEVILPLVNEKGQRYAANQLRVAESTICEWLMRNGYKRIVRYVKVEQEQAS